MVFVAPKQRLQSMNHRRQFGIDEEVAQIAVPVRHKIIKYLHDQALLVPALSGRADRPSAWFGVVGLVDGFGRARY